MALSENLAEQKITLTSLPINIVLIEPFMDSFRQLHAIDNEIYGNMMVCITEAVNNSIIHGNKCEMEKRVSVRLRKEKNTVTCVIQDEGCGFDFNNLPDPTAPENIESCGGRGVFLMKNLSDLVIFSNDGTIVEIQFKL